MKLPHENYIRFLITTGLDSKATNNHLESLNLVGCDVEYWDEQYEQLMDAQLPKSIKKYWKNTALPFPKGFVEYMNVVGLKEAWLYNIGKNKHFTLAVDAAYDPDVSITIKSLLALRVDHEEISALINGKFGMPFPKESSELFQKYFFNNKIMMRADWRLFLSKLEDEEQVLLYRGITGQSMELRAELGLPNKISVSEQYQKIHVFAMEKFQSLRGFGDPKTDGQALKWAQMAMSSGDRYEKLKTSDASDFGRDLQMEFETISTEFPMIGASDLDQLTDAKKEGTKKDESRAQPIPLQTDMEEIDDTGA